MALRLPEPMLARAGEIPRGSGWSFEPKLDGFRCMVCTHATFLARSRRGWDMTHLLPEFRRGLPLGTVRGDHNQPDRRGLRYRGSPGRGNRGLRQDPQPN